MLVLIGLGIWDEKDISLRGIEELKSSEIIFAENYTDKAGEGALGRLEKIIGKKIILLPREDVEGEKKILDEAKAKKVALVTGGDPLIATTHISLLLSAKKAGIETRVIHSSSIMSAAMGESGLQAYKFGKSATVSFWSEKYRPESTYDSILQNKKSGLHTLLFLDIGERMMEAREALSILQEIEKKRRGKIARANDFAVVLSRLGSEEMKISFGKIGQLEKSDLGKPPFVIVMPGKLHFMEKEALESL
ncbi:MAG: diphthine synthase [Candidatus Micrarchaeota archaeon]|nr:diphthine synthase [Candidatus Micrarchaeota archaeon]